MTTTLTIDGVTPFQVSQGAQVTVAATGTFDGATVTLGYPITGPVAATLAVNDADETPALNLFANDGGTQGNAYTLTLLDAGPEVGSLSIVQSGPDFVITLTTSSGDAAAVTTALTGADNDITITADRSGAAGNAYSIELLAGSGTTQALSVSTTDNLKFSVTLGRTANAISSTAAQVVAALQAYAPFAALMTATVKGGETGTGLVTALAKTDLTGGGANDTITTTSADIVNFINASPICSPHFTAELEGVYDGAGLATALAETALAGGTFGTFAAATTALTAAGIMTARNLGVSHYMALTVTNDGAGTDIDIIANKIPKS